VSGTKARVGVVNTKRTREGPNRVVVLDEEEAMWVKTSRRAGVSDDAGSGSSMTKTQSAGRRPCVDGWRNRDCASRRCTGDGDVDATTKQDTGGGAAAQ